MSESRSFQVGEFVTWKSQAHGSPRTKFGTIAEVVAPMQRPSRDRFPSLYKHSGCGLGRNHESYVVMVKRTPFWPRVSHLEKTDVKP